MKKSFYLMSILIIGFITNTFGQDPLELTFTAQHNGQHVPLDSIMITNLTQGGDTMLYAPDTVLLIGPVGMNEHNLLRANSFSVSQNYPHPFIGQTFVDVFIVETANIEIRILDIIGREHASYEGVLDAGKHTFTFYPGNENFYIFSASYSGLTRSIKIANPLSGKQDCKLTYKGFEKQAKPLKFTLDGNLPFSLGDQLRYIGYSRTTTWIRGSDVIEDIPGNYELCIFDITEGIPCVNVPTVLYHFQLYNTVQIGTQCWLKENLNIGTMILGSQNQQNNGIIEKYCYHDDPVNCYTYGGLYQWDEMMQYTITQGIRGICPSDWHLPTDEEWKQLEGEVDSQYGYPDPEWDSINHRGFDVGLNLKSTSGWTGGVNGIDLYGFKALPGGDLYLNQFFQDLGDRTYIWSSTKSATGIPYAWYRALHYEWSPDESHRWTWEKVSGHSVRCIKD